MPATGKIQRLRKSAGRVNTFLPALLACALPLSTSALTVLAILILLFWLFEGNFKKKWGIISVNPVVVSVLAYLGILALGLLWSPDLQTGLSVLQARWKIALLPVFLTAISKRQRPLYITGFLGGLIVVMLMTYLAWFGVLHYADVTPEHLTPKTFHVVYNPLLAFGIYLVLHEAIWGRVKKRTRMGLVVLAALMTVDMFITEGRTGQLVFFVLITLLLFQIFPKNRFKAVTAACLLMPVLFCAGYSLSPVFKQRINIAYLEVAHFQKNPNTSVGQRLQFWCNSWRIIRHNPLLGVGTGGFQEAYARVNRDNSPSCVATDNPHNQYVLVAAMVGIPGVIALLLIFVVMFREAWIIDDHWRRIRFAFPLFFLTIMLTESYLKVYEIGFFFSLFTAVFYTLPQDEKMCGCEKSGALESMR